MARICSWDGCLLRALCDGFSCCLAVQYCDSRPGLQLVLSVDHHLLVGRETRIDEGLAAADLRNLHRPGLHRAVWIDDVDVGSIRTLLHGRCSNGEAVVSRIDEQSRVDEFAWPQLVGLVGKIRLELDRACCLQDRRRSRTPRVY